MRVARQLLSLSTVVALVACSDSGTGLPPLRTTFVTPPDQATGVETGAAVAVTFDQPIDPATIGPATFRVTRSGAALVAGLSYDAATQTARAVAPLLPDASYEIEVTTGVRTAAGAHLSATQTWGFTTRAWQGVTVDASAFVGQSSSLALDGAGRRHVSYSSATDQDLKYATCAAACTVAANWQTGTPDATGEVGNWTSLAVDQGGRVHVTHFDATNSQLEYATCGSACTVAANWQKTTPDPGPLVGDNSSLALDGSGVLHVSYHQGGTDDLKYATCITACTAALSWEAVTLDQTGNVANSTSLAVEASGTLHIGYSGFAGSGFKYATCAEACAEPALWQTVQVTATGHSGIYTSLAVDGSGRTHVGYHDGNLTHLDLAYATCAGACTTAAGWQTVTVDAAGNVGHFVSLAVDGNERVHVSYVDQTNHALKYATCAAECTVAASWQSVTIDDVSNVQNTTSLVVGQGGRLHVSYHDGAAGELKYLE